jgi:hypothetical protein
MSEQCVLCLDDMIDESLTIALDGCNHVMHTSCFLDYVKYNINKQRKIACPICRHIVVDIPMVAAPQVIPPPEDHIVYVSPPPVAAYNPPQKSRWRLGAPIFLVVMGVINLVYFLTWDAGD